VLLGLCILLLGFGWNMYRKSMIRLALLSALVLSISTTYQSWLQSRQQVLTVYDVKGSSVFDYYDGKRCTCFTDADTASNGYRFATQQNRWAHGIKKCEVISLHELWSPEDMDHAQKGIQLRNDLKIWLTSHQTSDTYDIFLQNTSENKETLLQIVDGTSKNRFRKSVANDGPVHQWYTAIDGAFQTK